MNLIEDAISKYVEDVAKAHEQYLLRFFGSVEAAKKNAHLFVFEVSDSSLAADTLSSSNASEVKLQITQTYRLRRKTEEELLAETNN